MSRSVSPPRRAWSCRSPVSFALFAAVLWLAFYNRRFWTDALAVIEPGSWGDALFACSIFLVLWLACASALLLVPGNRPLKAIAACASILAAVAAYFADAYGIYIDRDTIRNFIETDSREVWGLMNARFGAYLLLLGALPAAAIWRVRLPAIGWKRQVVQRTVFMACSALVCFSLFAAFNARYVSFIREHKAVRYLIVPANVVYGTLSYLNRVRRGGDNGPAEDAQAPVARRLAPAAKPVLLLLVIGETARAQNFQLGGYGRDTNPELARRGVHYFSNVTACGTSTAISLPCMFSGAGREAFDVDRARRNTNLLDALARAGVYVEWRENNSGCKGVCDRVRTINHTRMPDERYCSKGGCYDEVMLDGLPDTLSRLKSDAVVVFHQAGSHGPGYYERYPRRFETFAPVCRSNDLGRCSVEEVVNAYDNSVRYSDHVLARKIDLLRQAADSVDSILIYVSDHGESLGELGLYLHGAPFWLAPRQQTKVPFVVWMSDGYRKRFSLSQQCLRAKADRPFSHDNLYHTVLGVFGVTTARYRPAMDLFSSCGPAAPPGPASLGPAAREAA